MVASVRAEIPGCGARRHRVDAARLREQAEVCVTSYPRVVSEGRLYGKVYPRGSEGESNNKTQRLAGASVLEDTQGCSAVVAGGGGILASLETNPNILPLT